MVDSAIYKQSKDVVFRQEREEAILFNPDNSDVIVINSTGCFIWDLCNGKNSLKDIVAQMVKHFNTTPEKAAEDLSAFLIDLEKREFIDQI
jgi:hypothetical protein